MNKSTTVLTALAAAAVLAGTYAGSASAAPVHRHHHRHHHPKAVSVEVLAPRHGDNAGVAGAGWTVDLGLDFRHTSLAATGFSANQLTGPAAHANTAPFPGTFSTGADDRLPGLVVLASTTNSTLPGFSGPGTNLANLFNLTGVADRSAHGVRLFDTWIVGAPIAGKDVTTTLTVAVVKDLNHDGVYNDAPAVVTDTNGDGRIDRRDLEAIGVASKIETVTFRINGAS